MAGYLKISVLGLLILFGEDICAKDLGVLGTVYEIKEQDAYLWIKERLDQLQASGEIEKQQQKMKEAVVMSIRKPKTVMGLRKTTIPRTFEQDLTIYLPYDIRGIDGQIIHPAGTRINPLETITSHKVLVFLDGSDQEQVAWALKELRNREGLAKLVLVNGSIIDLMENHQVRFYFDQSGHLIRRFKIEQVPAIVEQKGKQLMISEVKL